MAGGLLAGAALGLGGVLLVAWAASFAVSALVPGPELHPGTRRRSAAVADVTVVVPMRDEAVNVEGCLAALRAQRGVDLEVVVVDDGSRDGTAQLARAALQGMPRWHLVEGAPLPEGWVGKPWACHQGARVASGRWLAFVDADVRFEPGAMALLLDDAAAAGAQVLSGVGCQVLGSAWERVVNPVVFFFIAALTPLPLARRPGSRVVAVNGQLLVFRREAYEELGGHAAVRDAVVEDLALGRAAKERYGAGYRFVWARDLFRTRMYRSFPAMWEGWSKNMALGAAAVGLHPAAVVVGAVVGGVGPWAGLLALPLAPAVLWPWAAAAACQAAAVGVVARRFSGEGPWWGLTAPVGMGVVVALAVASWRRTRRGEVRWRGRAYRAER